MVEGDAGQRTRGAGHLRRRPRLTGLEKVLKLVGLAERLPTFSSLDAATAALQAGKKPRSERPLRWLTDLELASERELAQAGSDAATQRLADAIAEQDARRQEASGSVDE